MADLRRCIGSARFGIAAHDAPIADFPSQPSQKDGLGRMCKTHWNEYTASLARDAKARKQASEAEAAPPTAAGIEAEPTQNRARRAKAPTPAADGEGDAP
jgi:hypothetical protein